MEVLIHSKTDVEHEIEIVVSEAELQPHFEKGYRERATKITIPGFRPGKAPMQLIKRYLGPGFEYEIIEKLANEYFKNAIDERAIKPITQPVLETLDWQPGQPAVIKVKYETAPEVVAKDYKGLQLEYLTHEVTPEEVEDELRKIQRDKRVFEDVEAADDDNYRVTIEIQMLTPVGAPIPGSLNDNLVLDLDDDEVNRDLKAELLNMKVGEEKNVEFPFQKADGEESIEYAHLKVKSVQRFVLPELSDALAAEVTNNTLPTLDELRQDIEKQLVNIWARRYEEMLHNDVRLEIIKRNPFNIPPKLIEALKKEELEKLRKRQPDNKLPDDFDVESYYKHIDAQVLSSAKWTFLSESIIKQDNITMSDEDMMTMAREQAERLGMDAERLLEYYKSDYFVEGYLHDKLMKTLIEASEVKKISDDDVSRTAMAPFEERHHDHEHDGHDHHEHDGHDHHEHDGHDHHEHDGHDHHGDEGQDHDGPEVSEEDK